MRWPDAATVLGAARRWARRLAAHDRYVLAVACFGSYARGEASVGSDLDLLVIVSDDRGEEIDPKDPLWAADRLPVPADRLVYTSGRWAELRAEGARFARTLLGEAVWLVGRPP